jgi:WD40-like Beta Propeller Repeat
MDPRRRFLLYERGGIGLLDTITGTEELVAPGTDIVPEIGEEFALSPDGRLIAYQLTEYRVALGVAAVGTSGNVYQLDKLVSKGSWGLTRFGGLTWSPDGQEVAFYLSSGEES